MLYVAVAGVGALLGFGLLLEALIRCDESCAYYSGRPSSWRVDGSSGAWDLIGAGGVIALVLAVAVVVAVSVRPMRPSAWLPAAAIAVMVALAPLASSTGSVVDALPLAEAGAAAAAVAVSAARRLVRAPGTASAQASHV